MKINPDELLMKIDLNHELVKDYDFCLDLSASLHTFYIDDQVNNCENKIMNIIGRSQLDNNIVLMPKQLEALLFLKNNHNVVLSATTSFGKTFLMFEYIKRNESRFSTIVYIVHTVTLHREILGKCKKFFGDSFNVVDSFDEYNKNSKNLFIIVSDGTNPFGFNEPIDLLIIDEAYNLGQKDELNERYFNVYSNCVSLIKKSNKTVLVGPFISNVKTFDEEIKRKNFKLYVTDYSPVTSVLVEGEELGAVSPINRFVECVNEGDNTLYFINSKTTIYKIMSSIVNSNFIKSSYNDSFIRWMEGYFPDYWLLPKMMKKGISVFHSNFPPYLNNYCMNKFNKGVFRGLLTTSSILEGINTSTKNIVINDDRHTEKTLTPFRFFNLCGRAGRLNKNICIGKIYNYGPLYSDLYDKRKLELCIGYESNDPIELYNLGIIDGDGIELVQKIKEQLASINIEYESFVNNYKMCYFGDIRRLKLILEKYELFKYGFYEIIDGNKYNSEKTLLNSDKKSIHKNKAVKYLYENFIKECNYGYKQTTKVSVPTIINCLISSSYKGLSSNLNEVLQHRLLQSTFANKSDEDKNAILVEILKIAYGYLKYNYMYINRILREFINNDGLFDIETKAKINESYFDRVFNYLNENGQDKATRLLIEQGLIPPLASKIVSHFKKTNDELDVMNKNEITALAKNIINNLRNSFADYEIVNIENSEL